ncbi:hypothetical protein NPIL_122971 [Nephila pilipes]|uniref:Uncharacterized protein n=1 Tax=Nephila pilipes TaxID=299642 RepID=A0A8X6QUS5_NEPPI|nr:hypothetical protein NPIL_122971 [Nephila pilipes]
MITLFFEWYWGKGVQIQSTILPKKSYNICYETETEKNGIPIVYSFMIFKICAGLDIKVQLAPIDKRALNLPAKLELNEELNVQVEERKNSSRSKAPPIVNSVIIYKICLTLGLPVQLNEEAWFATT